MSLPKKIKPKDLLIDSFPAVVYATQYHLNTNGQKLDFNRYVYLKALLTDQAKTVVVMKSVQIGFTEILVTIAISAAGALGLTVFYVVPNNDYVPKTVKVRFEPLLMRVPFYRTLTQYSKIKASNAYMWGVGNGLIHFVGSEAKASGQSFPVDLVIVDELDYCNKDNLPKIIEDRIRASSYKRQILVSNPTIEGTGISELYEDSDKKQWCVMCQHCRELQALDWFVNIVDPVDKTPLDKEWDELLDRDIKIYCRSCSKEMNRYNKGAWIPRKQSRISGYQTNSIISPTVAIREIWKVYKKALRSPIDMGRFLNSDLGLPASGASYQVTDEMLHSLLGDYPLSMGCQEATAIGCDVGGSGDHPQNYYWVIGLQSSKVYNVGMVSDLMDLLPLIDQMNVQIVVVDAEPEISYAKRFQDKAKESHPYVTILRADTLASSGSRGITRDFDHGMIRFTKTEMYDELFGELSGGRITLPEDIFLRVPEFKVQMKGCKRVPELVKDKQIYIWKKTGEDHYFSAGVFALAGRIMLGHGGNMFEMEPVIPNKEVKEAKQWKETYGAPSPFSLDLDNAPWKDGLRNAPWR